MKTEVISGLMGAYKTPYSTLPVGEFSKGGSFVLGHLQYLSPETQAPPGWVKVGDAAVTLTLRWRDQVVAEQVAEMEKRIIDMQTCTDDTVIKLRDDIAALLALPNEVTP